MLRLEKEGRTMTHIMATSLNSAPLNCQCCTTQKLSTQAESGSPSSQQTIIAALAQRICSDVGA